MSPTRGTCSTSNRLRFRFPAFLVSQTQTRRLGECCYAGLRQRRVDGSFEVPLDSRPRPGPSSASVSIILTICISTWTVAPWLHTYILWIHPLKLGTEETLTILCQKRESSHVFSSSARFRKQSRWGWGTNAKFSLNFLNPPKTLGGPGWEISHRRLYLYFINLNLMTWVGFLIT